MFCENCGKEIGDNDVFCPNCGKAIKEKKIMQEEKILTESDVKSENPNTEPKKKKSGKAIVVLGIVAIVIIASIFAMKMFGGNSKAKEIVEKLKDSTMVSKTENGYEFAYGDIWTLCYTEETMYVKMSIPSISEYFAETLVASNLGDDGTFKYNLKTEELNMYCDTELDGENLSAITYNIEDDEFTFIVNGERYETEKEYAQQIKDDNIAVILKSNVDDFVDDLNYINLTKDDVANLTYKDIKANVDDKELKTVKKDKESEAPEREETKPEPEVETESEEEPVKEPQEESSESNEKENVLTDPITMGWAGTYKDDDSGERLVIASIGYEWSYVMYTASGQVGQKESGCSAGKDYLEGQYYTFYKNENGLLGVTSGVGQGWGNYRRISGTSTPDLEIEGTYENDTTTITVSEQMAEASTEYVPTGADIAAVHVKYNNGLEINGRLYTQGDGGLAIIDSISKEIYGTATFKNNQVEVTGSGFDGILKSK